MDAEAVDAARLAGLVIGIVGVAVAAASAARTQGERPLALLSLVLGVVGIAVAAALTVLLPPIPLADAVLWVLVLGGACVGVLAAAAVRIRRDHRGLVIRGGAWHLVPVSVALVGLQVAAWAGTSDGVVIAAAAIVACASFVAAAAAVMLLRAGIVRLGPVTAGHAVTPAGGPFPALRPAAPAAAAEVAAGSSLSASRPSAPAGSGVLVGVVCGACGASVRSGWRHCVTCGATLAW